MASRKRPTFPPSLSAQVSGMISAQSSAFQQAMAFHRAAFASAMDEPEPKPPLRREAQFDPEQPDTLGWRAWVFVPPSSHITEQVGNGMIRITETRDAMLMSPHMHTLWYGPELHVQEPWTEAENVRGHAGIHARLMPYDWKKAKWPWIEQNEGPLAETYGENLVTGVVERFGRFALGKTGWRAEWVIIRALLAKTNDIGLVLEQKYDVPVYYEKE